MVTCRKIFHAARAFCYCLQTQAQLKRNELSLLAGQSYFLIPTVSMAQLFVDCLKGKEDPLLPGYDLQKSIIVEKELEWGIELLQKVIEPYIHGRKNAELMDKQRARAVCIRQELLLKNREKQCELAQILSQRTDITVEYSDYVKLLLEKENFSSEVEEAWEFRKNHFINAFNATERGRQCNFLLPRYFSQMVTRNVQISEYPDKYIELPKELRGRKGLLNILCEDDYSFAYCLSAFLFPVKGRLSEIEKATKYRKAFLKFNSYSYDYPVTNDHVKEIERTNKMKINIYIRENEQLIPILLSSIEKKRKEMNLLLLETNASSHFVLIRSFTQLIGYTEPSKMRFDVTRCCLKRYTNVFESLCNCKRNRNFLEDRPRLKLLMNNEWKLQRHL